METFSAHADAWSLVYAALLAVAIAAQVVVAVLALGMRRGPPPLRRASAIISLVQLAALAATPLALALRAGDVAGRFGVNSAATLAVAWGAPVLAVPCLATAVVAAVLALLLLHEPI